MFDKIKRWFLGSVIMKKVAGKFAKHAAGAAVGLLSLPVVSKYMEQLGVTVDQAQMEAGLVVLIVGAFGAARNFVEHRLKD